MQRRALLDDPTILTIKAYRGSLDPTPPPRAAVAYLPSPASRREHSSTYDLTYSKPTRPTHPSQTYVLAFIIPTTQPWTVGLLRRRSFTLSSAKQRDAQWHPVRSNLSIEPRIPIPNHILTFLNLTHAHPSTHSHSMNLTTYDLNFSATTYYDPAYSQLETRRNLEPIAFIFTPYP